MVQPHVTDAQRRRTMVDEQVARRGISGRRLLEAMAEVPRERFVTGRDADLAYADRPLPIGHGQTISQPYIVAAMIDAAGVSPFDRVLEVGTGSGYGAAVLGRVAAEVISVERHAELADAARARLEGLGYDNVTVAVGDGSTGYAAGSPYDAVIVTASGPEVPPPLIEQLAEGGRLVMPVQRDDGSQRLIRATVTNGSIEEQDLGAVRFVPLIGAHAWSDGARAGTTGGGDV
ncbi:MAG: protein-L-isoaspartate(D-aspartate) O-methyltransferase [Microthrixaceae bacterium]